MAKINILKNIIYRMRNFIIRIFKIRTFGAQAMVVDKDKVLLIHHTYINNWYLIGGTIEPGERSIDAVKRELMEEVGVTCMSEPKLFGIYHNTVLRPDDHIALYIIEDFIKEKSESPEVESMKWYRMDELPDNISPAARRRIEEYLGRRETSYDW